MSDFSHYNKDGQSAMVDVSEKKVTTRLAKAEGFIKMDPSTVETIDKKLLPKGNPFEVAKIAGITAAKKNFELIPMCHPLLLTYVDVSLKLNKEKGGVDVSSEVRLQGQTGVEMEALMAVSVAALTIYDMCKAVDKNMVIQDIKVIEKKGGKSDYLIK